MASAIARRMARLLEEKQDAIAKLKSLREELIFVAGRCSETPGKSDTSRMRSMCDMIEDQIHQVEVISAQYSCAVNIADALELGGDQ